MKRFFQRTLIATATLFIIATGYLWLTFASPFGYQPGDNLPTIDDNARYSVFVYGTLQKPWVRYLVMGRSGTGEPATLPEFKKEALDITPAPGEATPGQVINVSGIELRALDRYERLGVRYERVKLTLESGNVAWVYRLINAEKTAIFNH
jgi:gamma-glutamylcyclotransferase (GGCT)/AIG2-like uncharacterized protein YtfP